MAAITNRKHGMAHGREWKTYYAMLDRCTKPDHKYYYRYGGRGIKICQRWLESFENFIRDMGNRPEGATLERIDNDKGYEPGNCRWASRKDQARNRRNNFIITAFGKTKTLAEWADISGLHYANIRERIKKGWSPERALSDPSTPRPLRHARSKLHRT